MRDRNTRKSVFCFNLKNKRTTGMGYRIVLNILGLFKMRYGYGQASLSNNKRMYRLTLET